MEGKHSSHEMREQGSTDHEEPDKVDQRSRDMPVPDQYSESRNWGSRNVRGSLLLSCGWPVPSHPQHLKNSFQTAVLYVLHHVVHCSAVYLGYTISMAI